jgi:hypothetical protein
MQKRFKENCLKSKDFVWIQGRRPIWSRAGLSAILALRIVWLNNRWEKLWEEKALAAWEILLQTTDAPWPKAQAKIV